MALLADERADAETGLVRVAQVVLPFADALVGTVRQRTAVDLGVDVQLIRSVLC